MELQLVRASLSKKDTGSILEATADALPDTPGKMRRYFRASDFPETGKRIAAAWEEGIRDTLQQTANLVPVEKPEQAVRKRGSAASEALILESLRKKKGHFIGPQRALAEEVKIPISTLNAALRGLQARKILLWNEKRLCRLPIHEAGWLSLRGNIAQGAFCQSCAHPARAQALDGEEFRQRLMAAGNLNRPDASRSPAIAAQRHPIRCCYRPKAGNAGGYSGYLSTKRSLSARCNSGKAFRCT
jgi:hypothetical protein